MAKDLAVHLAEKKQEEAMSAHTTVPPGSNKYAERCTRELKMLQDEYDKKVDEVKKKVREKEHTLVEREVIKLGAQLASLREQQEVRPESGRTPTVSPTAELKALQGQWKVAGLEKGANADFSLNGLGGESFDMAAVNQIDF